MKRKSKWIVDDVESSWLVKKKWRHHWIHLGVGGWNDSRLTRVHPLSCQSM